MVLAWIIIFSMFGSVLSVAGAGSLLLFPGWIRRLVVPALVSYATGALLGAAFLGIIPASLEEAGTEGVMATILAGIVVFFVLEKLVLWRHCHKEECEIHGRAGPLILIGDAFHNFVDGIVIAAAFLTSVSLGITAAVAVIVHEMPQEVGDFGILLDSGYERSKAFALNTTSSVATLPGALAAYFWLEEAHSLTPYILALSAASFIYIAAADLIPELHRQRAIGTSVRQFVLLVAGIGTIALFHLSGIGAGH